MSNYIGFTPEQFYESVKNRFFYGLRRTDNGELFLAKADQLKDTDSISINKPGDFNENFPNFQEGQDFFEGRDINHRLIYDNLNYEQFRWDDRNLSYYVNDEGELVVKTTGRYTYSDTVSSSGNETNNQIGTE
jgi:hypothetical protein